MKEIKFRGQRIDNGKWVYGFLYKLPLPAGVACMILTTDNNHEDSSIEPKYHLAFTLWVDLFVVRPETIGLYTGLKDKNGKEIYEGDIIYINNKPFGYVKWNPNGYFYIHTSTIYEYQDCVEVGKMIEKYPAEVEVVSNIHDNTELFK